jgi:hypothetical protein
VERIFPSSKVIKTDKSDESLEMRASREASPKATAIDSWDFSRRSLVFGQGSKPEETWDENG